jgi:integrase
MAGLSRSKSGTYVSRKGIPKDVQAEYAKLYGQGWEAKLTLSASLRPTEAKARHAEWLSEIENRITTIRARLRGERQSLSQKQAQGLAGEWYRAFTSRHEDNPGSPQSWMDNFWTLVDRLEDFAPTEHLRAHEKDLDALLRNPEVRDGIRPAMAKEARVDQFLTDKGLSLTDDAYKLLLDSILSEYAAGVLLLERRARGDFSPDERAEQFPKFEAAPKPNVDPKGLTPLKLWEAWVDARKPKDTTVDRWRSVFIELQKHFPQRTAGSITGDDAQTWAESLVNEKRSAVTVKDIWCNAANTVFGWAVSTKRLTLNPFKGVKIVTPRKRQLREKSFRSDEIATILTAALAITDTKTVFKTACRWVPWICAYSGARAGEITQLRRQDVIQREGMWSIQITPEAGTVKTGEARTVPLHDHLIEQGFVDFVQSQGSGPLFYNDDSPTKMVAVDPLNPPKARSIKTRERIAEWVRDIGVTDKAVKPNHAWRHTFKQIAERAQISEKVSDAITGHAPANVARSYGAPSVSDMAEALQKFPRYKLNPTKDEGADTE